MLDARLNDTTSTEMQNWYTTNRPPAWTAARICPSAILSMPTTFTCASWWGLHNVLNAREPSTSQASGGESSDQTSGRRLLHRTDPLRGRGIRRGYPSAH